MAGTTIQVALPCCLLTGMIYLLFTAQANKLLSILSN